MVPTSLECQILPEKKIVHCWKINGLSGDTWFAWKGPERPRKTRILFQVQKVATSWSNRSWASLKITYQHCKVPFESIKDEESKKRESLWPVGSLGSLIAILGLWKWIVEYVCVSRFHGSFCIVSASATASLFEGHNPKLELTFVGFRMLNHFPVRNLNSVLKGIFLKQA